MPYCPKNGNCIYRDKNNAKPVCLRPGPCPYWPNKPPGGDKK